jgi:hypothetical protein
MLRSLLNTDIRSWALGVLFFFLVFLAGCADRFIRCRDVGPPRIRIDPDAFLVLVVIAAFSEAWAFCVIGPVGFVAAIWLNSRASRKDRAWGAYVSGDSRARGALIVPNLSRRLAGTDSVRLLPRVCLERLSDAEVEALLARQAAPLSRWTQVLASVIPFCAVILGVWAAPPSLAPLLSITGPLCLWAGIVWVCRRLDAQADAKAIQATGDPASYIQALVKADRLMQEIPPRHRMSTWWLLPVSLEARIAAITAASPRARDSG